MAQAMPQTSLVGELEANVEIKASATKFYNMLARRPQDVTKANPDSIKGCDLKEGEFGKVGGILYWNYVLDGQPKVMKERFEAFEPDKNLIRFSVIDGDIMKDLKSLFVTIKATPKETGSGSVVKCQFKYEKNDDKVANPDEMLALVMKTVKDMDEMLMSEA